MKCYPVFFLLLMVGVAACTPAQGREPSVQSTPINEDIALLATETGVETAVLTQQLTREEAISTLAQQLEANEADSFAGLWIEREPTYRVVVAFTENGAETIANYVATGSPLTAVLDTRPATYSYAQLLADQQALHPQLANANFDYTTSVSVQTNQVELTVPSAGIWQSYLEQHEVALPPSVVVAFAFDDVAVVPPPQLTPFPEVTLVQKRLPSLMFMEALLSSNLLVADGCLFADEPNGRLLIIWEPGYFAHQGENGRLQILNEAGDVVAEEGKPLYMGGGEGSPPSDASLLAPLPDACRTSNVWHMGEFLPDEYRPQD